MTTKTAVITASVMVVVTVGAMVVRNSSTAPPPSAAAVCPTARPLPPYAPTPAAAYCTEKRYYVRACEPGNVYTRMWTTAPGFAGQICSAHTWAWADVDGFVYPIVDQGPTSFKYSRPPATAPSALAAWVDCWVNHNPPAGGYNCSQVPAGGTLIYHPITLAEVPNPPRDSWGVQYGCCETPSPTVTPTAIPVTPGPGTPTPASQSQYVCVTVTPKP